MLPLKGYGSTTKSSCCTRFIHVNQNKCCFVDKFMLDIYNMNTFIQSSLRKVCLYIHTCYTHFVYGCSDKCCNVISHTGPHVVNIRLALRSPFTMIDMIILPFSLRFNSTPLLSSFHPPVKYCSHVVPP